MLLYRRTSILESTAQTVVNTVNCVGVMGKGLAQAFKAREPSMFIAYKSICERGLLEPGKLWLWQGSDQWILNFPTKKHWRHPSRLEWVEAGLQKFVAEYASRGITEISFPRLGCGNGNLDWNDVRPLMARYLEPLDIPVYVHDYEVDIGLPEHLEAIADQLQSEGTAIGTFDGFLKAIRRIAKIANGSLQEIDTRTPFKFAIDKDGILRVSSGDFEVLFEPDDLRGVWVSLGSGLVTLDEAGWSDREGASAILAILSVLPNVRPIQVQTSEGQPEIAVELTPEGRKNESTPRPAEPSLLTWA
ncbi:MAG TPA: macro domain-containing protein [Devosia sp.]|nr:macro domain-containing protein [Devosia sp.]